jgi:putative addiction module antidote protein, CC2985 family
MMTCNVVLTSEQADLVERLVSAGRYQNASEALRAGLRLLEREEIEAIELRERLLTSLRQAKNGELAEGSGQSIVRSAFSAAQHSEK